MAGVPGFISEGPWWGVFAFLCCVVFLRAQATYLAGRWLRLVAAMPVAATPVGAGEVDAEAGAAVAPPAIESRVDRLLLRFTRQRADADLEQSWRSRLARRLEGPGWAKAQAFLERWGFVGVPVSFLTIGFQTLVNAAAGFTRMRWDLYTLAMIPGCLAWAAIYATLGVGLWEAWQRSPLLFLGVLTGLMLAAWILTTVRRRTAR